MRRGISTNAADSLVRWERPGADRFKCNVDVAFRKLLNKMSYGCCFGTLLGSFSMNIRVG